MWYYSQNSQQLGPVSEQQLRDMARSGQLGHSTLVWKEGMSDWKPLTEIAELAVLSPVAAPRSTVTPSPIQPSANPYASPQSVPMIQPQPHPMSAPINSGGILAFAICTTVLCCLPFGVPGIVYAAQISSKQAMGDFAGAAESARRSKMWSWISLGVGLLVIVLYAIAVAAGAASGSIR